MRGSEGCRSTSQLNTETYEKNHLTDIYSRNIDDYVARSVLIHGNAGHSLLFP